MVCREMGGCAGRRMPSQTRCETTTNGLLKHRHDKAAAQDEPRGIMMKFAHIKIACLKENNRKLVAIVKTTEIIIELRFFSL